MIRTADHDSRLLSVSLEDTIQGRYPMKPKPRSDLIGLEDESVYIPGNEGLGVVEQLGSDVDPGSWKVGDWGMWLGLLLHRHCKCHWAHSCSLLLLVCVPVVSILRF